MLRRYFSLFIPMLLLAAGALTWLHFQQSPRAVAQDAPMAQVPPPPAERLIPEPRRRPTKPPVEKPKNRDEVQTPMLRNLLDQLEGMSEGTDEEKGLVRDMIFSADVELRDALGDNMQKRIRAANVRRPAFKVEHYKNPAKPKAKVIPGMKPPVVKPAPEVVKPLPEAATPEVEPVPPVKPAPPKEDVFDDIFNEKK
ncbi:MAG TPA: hypothetical protein VL096_00870 [Pirellulaceae bacterium]|nr:hypothetical protein [Pirellulaceae bacterium]